ncbi:unnamed protein product, partial [Ixodes persulcatus]
MALLGIAASSDLACDLGAWMRTARSLSLSLARGVCSASPAPAPAESDAWTPCLGATLRCPLLGHRPAVPCPLDFWRPGCRPWLEGVAGLQGRGPFLQVPATDAAVSTEP